MLWMQNEQKCKNAVFCESRRFVQSGCLSDCAIFCLCCSPVLLRLLVQRAADRPNILFIISDDHAYQAVSA